MNIVKSATHLESSEKAALEIARQIIQKPASVLGLATGSTPLELYKKLIKYYEEGFLSFRDVLTFNLDEYVSLSAKHKNSYAYFMREQLFDHIDINLDNCHIPNGLNQNIEEECARYEDLLGQKGPIDIQVLGIGKNGHIGFNEPSDAIIAKTHLEKLTQSTLDANSKYFTDMKMPTKALSMGIGSIMQAKKILLLATGEDKSDAIYKCVHGEISPNLPASYLQLHPDVTIYVDEMAGKNI